MKKIIIVLIILFLAAVALAQTQTYYCTFGEDVTYAWDANSEDDLAGYKIYWSATSGGPYTLARDMPLPYFEDPANPTHTAQTDEDTLSPCYNVLTAYDESGNESGYSDEICLIFNEPADTTPPAEPSGFKAIIEKLISWLKGILSIG